MKKILITSLFAIILISNQLNAEETKQTKKKELSAEDKKLVDEIMKSQKDIEESKAKTKALDKLEKTVDELGNKLGVDKK